MNSRLVIWGAGGHGKVILDIACATGRFQDIAFLDDYRATIDPLFDSYPVIDPREEQKTFKGSAVVVAVGNNRARAECLGRAIEYGLCATTLLHPTAVVAPSTTIGQGTVVMPGVIINAG